jgi:hypothetical protein
MIASPNPYDCPKEGYYQQKLHFVDFPGAAVHSYLAYTDEDSVALNGGFY